MKRMFLLLLGDEFKEYFSLTTKQKFYVWYFCLSFCFLCITDDSPIWAIIVVPPTYIYTDTEGNTYFCNTYGANAWVYGAGSGVVYYGYLYNKEDNTGDKFDTNLDGWKWSMAYEFFKGLVDCIDKPVNVPDEFREISKDYYNYELGGSPESSIQGTVFDKVKGGHQGFIHPYAAHASNTKFCDEDWGAMVASILTWDKAELEEIYVTYPLIKAKYDIVKAFFTEQYGLDIEQLANRWRNVTLD